MELQKTIESLKRYINSQEQKLDDYYRMDEEFYKYEIEELELSLKLLRAALNHLAKQDKMIELMTDMITELKPAHFKKEKGGELAGEYRCFNKKEWKQYFEKKAEEIS